MATQKVIRWISTAALLVASFASARVAYAQGAVITGKVTTSQGRELEGANVTIPELNISVGTNGAGNYTISIPAARLTGGSAVLRVRSIGYVPQTRTVSLTAGSQSANFSLQADVNRLQAVVTTGVTGATETTKLPFSVARIDSSDLKVPASNPLSQLAGKVPGAAIVSASGRPGASPAVILRGPTAITGAGRGQTPLYIVDGVIVSDQGANTAGGGLPDINPLDIESVEVVKGAAASSLYGARAGNGVITIRTKSGLNSSEGVHFTARTEYGTSDVEHHIDIAQNHALELDETGQRFCIKTSANATYTGTYQCAQSINYAQEVFRINDQGDLQALSPLGTFPVDPNSSQSRTGLNLTNSYLVRSWPGQNYDAVSQFVRPKPLLNNSIDMRGRFGKTAFFASANNLDQGGAIQYLDGFQRQSARLNLDQTIGTRWSASLTSYYAKSRQDGFYAEDDGNGAFFRLTRSPPIANDNAVDSKGRLFIRTNLQSSGTQNNNPLYPLQNDHEFTKGHHYIGGGTLRYAAFSWMDLEGNLSYDGSATNLDNFDDKGYRQTNSSSDVSFLRKSSESITSYNSGINMNIRHDLVTDMHTRTSLRYGYGREDYDYRRAQVGGLSVIGVPALGNGSLSQSVSSTVTSIRSIGFITAENIEYKDRYILDGLVRRDASSLFGAGNRWQTFGRGSVAWRVSQEPFWFIPAIDEFKLRASIGTAGGRPGFASQYQTFGVTNGIVSPGILGNNFLKPESIRENEYGIDMEAFHRIGITLNYSLSNSRDQILLVPLPAASGFSNQWQNAGVLQNKTFEGSINVPIINGRDVQYSTRFIYDHNRAVITHLYVPQFSFGSLDSNQGAIFLACSSTAGEKGSCNKTAANKAIGQNPRYAEFYGRDFVRSCSMLPTGVQSACGPGKDFQQNKDGFIVWIGAGNTPSDGITKNLWTARLPSTSSYYAQTAAGVNGYFSQNVVPISWGQPIVVRDSTGQAIPKDLGNPLPNFRWGFSQTLNVKRLTAYALIDASIGQHVWNQGRGWSYLDFLEGREDQAGKSVADAIPIGYYYRAGAPDNSGTGGLYDVLGPNNYVVENASYAKLREVNLGYHVGHIGTVGGDWSLSLIGRNLHTWTKYTGFDPEVGIGAVSGSGSTSKGSGSAAVNAIDAFSFPNLRSFSFSLSSSF